MRVVKNCNKEKIHIGWKSTSKQRKAGLDLEQKMGNGPSFYLFHLSRHAGGAGLPGAVTSEDADNDKVLGLCLKLIDESRPFFIGLLGERYGWVPKEHPAEALMKYGWIKDGKLREHSVTDKRRFSV